MFIIKTYVALKINTTTYKNNIKKLKKWNLKNLTIKTQRIYKIYLNLFWIKKIIIKVRGLNSFAIILTLFKNTEIF